MQHILERRINQEEVNPLPDIVLIDGGKLQLDVALDIFYKFLKKPPVILSIMKGSKRVRSTETILSKDGIIEMPKNSAGFKMLQQIRDESHRFAINSNRNKKKKSVKFSSLDSLSGVGSIRKKKLIKTFKSLKAIKEASVEELCMVEGISINIAKEIKKNLKL